MQPSTGAQVPERVEGPVAGLIVYEYRYHRPMSEQSLAGRRIALLESRLGADIATLVKRLGGVPIAAPAVREVPHPDDVAAVLDTLTAGGFAVAIFQTGAGASALLQAAEHSGSLADVVHALGRVVVACRGPKPLGVMRKHAVAVQVTTQKPHTTRELLDALAPVDLSGRGVLLVHYGERNAALAAALTARGAALAEVCPYVWALPEDTGPLESVVREAAAGSIDALLITSQIQCRHLFQVAERLELIAPLLAGLNGTVVVGAVGPVAAEALRAAGVTPDVLPASPTMVSLISAVADYFELTQ
jgi:uroporphyrinogen-III synthase